MPNSLAIKEIHDNHEGRLGIDRLVAELAKLGRASTHPSTVRRLAHAAGLSCVHPCPIPGNDSAGPGQP
jgi:hypothetical protein